jgi:hypothetical protein
MLKRRLSLFFIVALIVMLATPTYFSTVSSSTGTIRINSTTTSPTGQTVMAGGNINLYFGGIHWDDIAFYLFWSHDASPQMSFSEGAVFSPPFSIYDVVDSHAHIYTENNQTWTVGYNWVNGSLPRTLPLGDY